MREDAFRAYLAPLLTARGVASYIANARRVERVLGIDLDVARIDRGDVMAGIADGLARRNYSRGGIAGSLTALRRYAEMSARTSPIIGTRSTARPSAAPPPRLRNALITQAATAELMRLYGDILAELRNRGVSRTANGPVGDYAEHLFARALGWKLSGNSESGFDARDAAGVRYQIKARRLSTPQSARQLSAIRRLPEQTFDVLAVVLFDEAMTVQRAALVPHGIVAERASFIAHTNSWRLMAPARLWTLPGVIDVTTRLREAA